MADEVESATKGAGNFLTHKVGPLPLGVWMVAAIGIYYVVGHKSKTAGSTGPTALTPSGTVGTTGGIGSSDMASGGGGGSDGSTGSGGGTIAGQYATNDAWARAAINYLVGRGVDPTAANSAITTFMASQPLSTEQQGDVNLAIQALGAPPQPPQPGTAPPPVVTPPGGVVYASNPPTGLTVSGKTPTSVTLTWNKVTNATGYTIKFNSSGGSVQSVTATATDTTAPIGGLTPNTLYQFSVQATPARPADAAASTFTTTPDVSTPAPTPTPTPVPTPKPSPTPAPDPHAGMHLQPPQVATLSAGRSLRDYAKGAYGANYQSHLDILVQLNPNEGGPDHKAAQTHLIRTSNERWVPN